MAFLHHLPELCLGFDLAKETLVVSDGRTVQVIDNRRTAIRRFLRSCNADFVVCEPTGGHETVLLEECLRLGLPAHRVDTRKLKAFIRSRGRLGKSDAIDARELAAYAWSDGPACPCGRLRMRLRTGSRRSCAAATTW